MGATCGSTRTGRLRDFALHLPRRRDAGPVVWASGVGKRRPWRAGSISRAAWEAVARRRVRLARLAGRTDEVPSLGARGRLARDVELRRDRQEELRLLEEVRAVLIRGGGRRILATTVAGSGGRRGGPVARATSDTGSRSLQFPRAAARGTPRAPSWPVSRAGSRGGGVRASSLREAGFPLEAVLGWNVRGSRFRVQARAARSRRRRGARTIGAELVREMAGRFSISWSPGPAAPLARGPVAACA
jgi:hypothetical protein